MLTQHDIIIHLYSYSKNYQGTLHMNHSEASDTLENKWDSIIYTLQCLLRNIVF